MTNKASIAIHFHGTLSEIQHLIQHDAVEVANEFRRVCESWPDADPEVIHVLLASMIEESVRQRFGIPDKETRND